MQLLGQGHRAGSSLVGLHLNAHWVESQPSAFSQDSAPSAPLLPLPGAPGLQSPPGSQAPRPLPRRLGCGGWWKKGLLVPAALLRLEQERDKGPILGPLSVSMSLVAQPPGGKAFEVFPWEMVANKSAVGWYSS